MEITALGYIGINSSQIDQWSQMATGLLGMEQVDRGGKMRAFRMDDRKQRLIVDGSSDAGLAVMGWEVSSTAELGQLAGRLESHGVKAVRGSHALADERHVAELIAFTDPAGNRLEAFCKPELASETRLVVGRVPSRIALRDLQAEPPDLGFPHRRVGHGTCRAQC